MPEGHVGIKMFGRADAQLPPGLNFKIPLIQTVETVEVRQRRNVEELTGATSEQLPIRATVSVNWTANKESALDLYVKYGGIPQFEERILDPKLRSVSKAAIAKFSAEDLIKNRTGRNDSNQRWRLLPTFQSSSTHHRLKTSICHSIRRSQNDRL